MRIEHILHRRGGEMSANILDLKARIEQALAVLIGLPLFAARRLPGMEAFQFGAEREVVDLFNHRGTVGTYALHVQCTWRITDPTGILVGWNDRYFPRGSDHFAGRDAFDYDVPGSSRCDERIATFFAVRARNLPMVDSIQGDKQGGFRLTMTDAVALEVFPDTTVDSELWRLFQPETGSEHFVVTGQGIEE